MTKKECEEAYDMMLESIRFTSPIYEERLALIKRLIIEHFDNPPLSFDDLKEGMWVWDDKEKLYGKVVNTKREYALLSLPGYNWGKYEKNRFYRRQKED